MSEQKYIDQTIKLYLDDLSTKKPAPGGGSAAALAGSLGASLVLMALNFTKGKPAYARFDEEISKATLEFEKIKNVLADLIDEDVAAYNKLKEARAGSGSEKEIQQLIAEATGIPLEILNLCYNAEDICARLPGKVNKNLITDVACGALFLDAGFEAAKFNVEINIKSMEADPALRQLRKDLAIKAEDMKRWKDKVLEAAHNTVLGR